MHHFLEIRSQQTNHWQTFQLSKNQTGYTTDGINYFIQEKMSVDWENQNTKKYICTNRRLEK